MKKIIAIAAALALASCGPRAEPEDPAFGVCAREDVKTLVGQEARGLIFKGSFYRLLRAEMFGLMNVDDVAKDLENAKVTFGVPGAVPSRGKPTRQFICVGTMQIDASNGTQGQQVLTIPRLRWSVNFATPSADPMADPFTVEVDPASIGDGPQFNGKPLSQSGPSEDGDIGQESRPQSDNGADEAPSAAEQAAAAADSAAREAARAAYEIGADAASASPAP